MKDWPGHTLDATKSSDGVNDEGNATAKEAAPSTLEQLKGGGAEGEGEGGKGRDCGSPGSFTDDFVGSEVSYK